MLADVLRRRQTSQAVELFRSGQGLVVQGDAGAVARYVDQMLEATGRVTKVRTDIADALAAVAHISAIARTSSRQYVELAPWSLDALEEGGAIPGRDGFFRGFLRDKASGNFAGFVDWKPASLGPEEALSLQAAAVHMALRSAIRDVADAIERVEGKVDKLVQLARAERLGAIVADRSTLEALVRRARESGQVSTTDWSTVDTLGADILRGIEALRAYVAQEVGELEPSRLVRSRSAELGELTEEMLRESLALLVVAEQNYALWQEVRVAHVVTHEPARLDDTLLDVRTQLDALAAADQSLIDSLLSGATRLLQPTGFEGLAPLAKRRLRDRGKEVESIVNWFASQRSLGTVDMGTDYPTLGESVGKAIDTAIDGVGAVGRQVLSLALRSNDDAPVNDSPVDQADRYEP